MTSRALTRLSIDDIVAHVSESRNDEDACVRCSEATTGYAFCDSCAQWALCALAKALGALDVLRDPTDRATLARRAYLEAVLSVAGLVVAEYKAGGARSVESGFASKMAQLAIMLQAEIATEPGGAVERIADAIIGGEAKREYGGGVLLGGSLPRWANPYATKSNAQLLVDANDLDRRATEQPWMVASSNSFRRINACSPRAQDGGVISATIAPDGHPDLTGANLNSDLQFVAAARSLVPELARRLAAARETLKHAVDELEKLRAVIDTATMGDHRG